MKKSFWQRNQDTKEPLQIGETLKDSAQEDEEEERGLPYEISHEYHHQQRPRKVDRNNSAWRRIKCV
jgi:hypothetical protein